MVSVFEEEVTGARQKVHPITIQIFFFEEPPLSKPFLWSFSQTDMWNKFRYEKRSIWHIRLWFHYMPGKERGNQKTDSVCNHASWFLNAANSMLMQAKPSCTKSKSLHLRLPVSASSSRTSWFLPTLKFMLPSEVCRQLAIPEAGAPLTPAGWTVCSLCAQDKAGAVRQSAGPWGRTHEQWHTSVLRHRNQLSDTELIAAAPQERTHFLAEFNCISGKTEDKSNHFLVQIFIWVAVLEILSHIWQDTCGKKPCFTNTGVYRDYQPQS